MKRDTAYRLLGYEADDIGSGTRVAQALGISRQAVYRWPHTGHLPRETADRVLAAAVRRRAEQRLAKRLPMDPLELDAIALE